MVKVDDQCTACSGKQTTQEKKTLEVHVEKGMKSGDRIVFRGEADEVPGVESGDIVFIVQVPSRDVSWLVEMLASVGRSPLTGVCVRCRKWTTLCSHARAAIWL